MLLGSETLMMLLGRKALIRLLELALGWVTLLLAESLRT